eukprot:6174953-Pleurochrysis_carterae.AAC.3
MTGGRVAKVEGYVAVKKGFAQFDPVHGMAAWKIIGECVNRRVAWRDTVTKCAQTIARFETHGPFRQCKFCTRKRSSSKCVSFAQPSCSLRILHAEKEAAYAGREASNQEATSAGRFPKRRERGAVGFGGGGGGWRGRKGGYAKGVGVAC